MTDKWRFEMNGTMATILRPDGSVWEYRLEPDARRNAQAFCDAQNAGEIEASPTLCHPECDGGSLPRMK